MEQKLEKYTHKKEISGRKGKWVTKAFLMDSLKYTKQLVAACVTHDYMHLLW